MRDRQKKEPQVIPDIQPQAAPSSLAPQILLALFFSSALVVGSFVWQGAYGFNMGDEGFLWYGVQRVQAGEVPLLDFISYDPGRYYWSTVLMALFHSDGIMALRIAGAVFEFLGLFVGLLLLARQRSKISIAVFAVMAITLIAWMLNWYKYYDTSISVMLIGVLAFLVRHPSQKRFFLTGVSVGLAAVFGRNHGLYGLAGILGVFVYLVCLQRNAKGTISGLAWCACGVVVGYLPILFMIVTLPGFAAAFWESIRAILDRGTSGLPLPVPWPWLVPVRQLPMKTAAAHILEGSYFVAILAFGILSTLWVIRQALLRRPVAPEFVATSMLALPYAHYTFQRAELFHLSLGIFPLLIGIFVFSAELSHRMQWILALVVACASLIVVLPQHPGWDCRVIERCVTMEIGGSTLKIQPLIATFVTNLESTVAEYAPNGRDYLVTPLWPAAYALFKRKSPMWDNHAVFPRSAEFERKEIERIKAANPSFALILDQAVDGRDDLRFRNSHPLTYQFVRDHFDHVQSTIWHPSIFELYKAR